MNATAWLDDLARALGPGGLWRPDVAADSAQMQPLLTDWRGRYQGRALAVARPRTSADVALVVRACAAQGVGIVPQGGNTGLVGGSVPDASGQQMLLSLQNLRQVRSIDAPNLSLVAEAGCTLLDVQAAAESAGLMFPLSMASQGSCTLGGNLATNAGGTQVLRYGTARELCLGLEVVTAQGEIWSGLSALRKDNTGYDLRDLFIGSEGTLGVITAASLRLHPQPQGRSTALIACTDLARAVTLLQRARDALDAGLTAFELMAREPLRLVQRHQPDAASLLGPLLVQSPATDHAQLPPQESAQVRGPKPSHAAELSAPPAWTVLIEHQSSESPQHAQERLQALLQTALTQGLIDNALCASSETQRQAMWHLRETIPLAEKTEGVMVKHDIGLPTSAIASFVQGCEQALLARWPQARIVCFGHLGDGNLHYNVQPPPDVPREHFDAFEQEVNELVFDRVACQGGTLSAEHGIGRLRREALARHKPAVALGMMRAIKASLDPQGIMNPARVL